MIIINDTHRGVNRSGGTTPVTYAALQQYTREQFRSNLEMARRLSGDNRRLLINGDLFDGFQVSNNVVAETIKDISELIDDGFDVALARGNHDIDKNLTRMSSFDLLCAVLLDMHPLHVKVITEPTRLTSSEDGCCWVLPHAPNQDIFDLWVTDVEADPMPYVFVHCNYNNGFAAESDHSLNMTAEQCQRLHAAGVENIIFAHEHQQGERPDGVIIAGNQFPTSISDCLGNDSKRLLQIKDDGLYSHDTWKKAGSYFECDWKDLGRVPADAQFVRVKGEAEASEASAVLDSVSRLRKAHSAFVITNAVVVDGRALDVTAMEAVEEVTQFNVMDFLLANLDTDAQRERVLEMHKEKSNA